MPTSSSSPDTCAGSPAPERARPRWPCGSSTPGSRRTPSRSIPASRARSTGPSIVRTEGSSRCPHTPLCSSCERFSRSEAWRVTTGHSLSSEVIWHDVECGAYGADLEAWEQLASTCSGPILELGCGAGRVCLHLARLGHEVWAVDVDGELTSALEERARAEGLPVRAVQADALELELGREFELAIAAMQLIQMLGEEPLRRRALDRVTAHLRPGGHLGAAILDGMPQELRGAPAPLPDVREVDGRIYSSLPVDVAAHGDLLELRRLRQEVSPDGALTESEHVDSLWVMGADTLEAEGEAVGLTAAGRLAVPSVDGYVGSVIVMLERP